MKIGRREVGEIVRGCVAGIKSSFLGSPRDVFRRPSAAPEPIAPKFLHTTFPWKYFVFAEFHPLRLSFGGVMPPTPSFASLQYGLPYTIWQAITMCNIVAPFSKATFSSLIVYLYLAYSKQVVMLSLRGRDSSCLSVVSFKVQYCRIECLRCMKRRADSNQMSVLCTASTITTRRMRNYQNCTDRNRQLTA